MKCPQVSLLIRLSPCTIIVIPDVAYMSYILSHLWNVLFKIFSGYFNRSTCPAEPMIPIFLLGQGIANLISWVTEFLSPPLFKFITRNAQSTRHLSFVKVTKYIWLIFSLVWLIFGKKKQNPYFNYILIYILFRQDPFGSSVHNLNSRLKIQTHTAKTTFTAIA